MSEEVRTTSSTGGEKGVKPERMDLIPRYPLEVYARHLAAGAEKYADHNWRKGYEWSKSYASLMRHLLAFWDGEDIDEETGSPHLAGVIFHAFALVQFTKDFPEFDDRFKPAETAGTYWAPAEEDAPVFDKFEEANLQPYIDVLNRDAADIAADIGKAMQKAVNRRD